MHSLAFMQNYLSGTGDGASQILRNKEIAVKLGIGQSAGTNILNGRYKNEEYINNFIKRINSELKL